MDNCHGFFSLLCLGRAATVQTYHPTKKLSIFSFLSPVFGEYPPKHAVDEESEESIVQRPNGQVRSFRGPPSWPSFSTGPWSSCIVTGHDRLMTVTSRRTMPAPTACMIYWHCGSTWCSKQPRAVCRKCFMFHLDRDRSRVDLRRWCDHASDRSEVFRLQANDVAWPGVACICKSMKLGIHSV